MRWKMHLRHFVYERGAATSLNSPFHDIQAGGIPSVPVNLRIFNSSIASSALEVSPCPFGGSESLIRTLSLTSVS